MVRVRGAGLRAETLDMRLVARVARGLAVIGGLALAGCDSGEKQAADAPAAAPASVGVVAVASRDVTPTVGFTGRVEAVDTVQLLARVAGFVAKVNFTEGADVKAGDLLFQLQKDEYQAQVLQAQGAGQAGGGGPDRRAAPARPRPAAWSRTRTSRSPRPTEEGPPRQGGR